MLKERNTRDHRWYQKVQHAKLAKRDYNRTWIYPSGLRRIDEAFMKHQGYAVSGHVPKTMADFKNGVYVVDGIQTTFSAAFQHTATSNATMTGGYGEELVEGGSFDSDTGWTLNANGGSEHSISNGKFISTNSADLRASTLDATGLIAQNGVYEVTVVVRSITSGSFRVMAYSDVNYGATPNIDTAGVHKFQIEITEAGTAYLDNFVIQARAAGSTFEIDNISVREVPKIQWRPHNLVTHSEDLTDWTTYTRASVDGNVITAPDGLTTADKIVCDNTAAASHWIQSNTASGVSSGDTVTLGAVLKAGELDYAAVYSGIVGKGKFFDLANGTVLGNLVSAPDAASITGLGDGWYLCQIEVTASGAEPLQFYLSENGTSASFDGDGTSGVYAWGAHLYRSDLGGMADVPATERVLPALTKYVRTAGRVIGEDLITNGDFSQNADELVTDGTFDARGAELVVGGTFQNGVDPAWTQATGPEITIDVQGGRAVLTNTVNSAEWYRQVVTIESGKVYEFRGTIQDGTSSNSLFRLTGATNLTLLGASTEATVTQYFTASSTTLNLDMRIDSLGTGYFDNISVREVTGASLWTGYVNGVVGISDSKLSVIPSVSATGRATYPITTEVGATYELSVDFVNDNGNTVLVGFSNNADGGSADFVTSAATSGTLTHTYTATATTTYISLSRQVSSATEILYDNISVKEAVPGWTPSDSGCSISLEDGSLRITNDDATAGGAVVAVDVVEGLYYRFLVGDADGGIELFAGSSPNTSTYFGPENNGHVWASSVTGTIYFMVKTTSTTLNDTRDIDNIKVEEVDVDPSSARYMARIGHHVFNGQQWVNEGLELESEARTNLVTYSSENFVVMGAGTATANDTTSPSGAVDATLYTTPAATAVCGARTNAYAASTGALSVYLKGNGLEEVSLWHDDGNSGRAVFNLTTGEISQISGLDGYGIEDIGNGWWRCFIYDATTTTQSVRVYAGNGSSQAYNGTDGFWLWGAQHEDAATPSSYTPTSGSSVTRAAETLVQTGDKAPWPTAVYTTNDELVTNGGFDSDVTGWTALFGTATWSSGQLLVTEDGADGSSARAYQTISTTIGNVYEVTASVGNVSVGTGVVAASNSTSIGGKPQVGSTGNESITLVFTAEATTTYIVCAVSGTSARTVYFDNISVKEINPRALSAVMDGRVTYADTNSYGEASFWRQRADSSNELKRYLDTFSTNTGRPRTQQKSNGTDDYDLSPADAYSPGINVPFKIASRHLDNALQGAADGTSTTENTTPVSLPDLETTDLAVGYDYMGTIRTFRMFDQDIASTGLVSSTEPSLEPTLSLVFDGSGDSYIDFDWSE